MKIQPLRDFIAVIKEEAQKKSAGGIILTEPLDEKIVKGTVVAVGSGILTSTGTTVPLEVKVGDVVYFNKNLAVEIKDGDGALHMLREEQILGKSL